MACGQHAPKAFGVPLRGSLWLVPRARALGVDHYHVMTITRYLFIFMGIFSLLFCGCGKKSTAQSPVASGAPIIKVAVFADGRITADGSPATVDSLRESFKKLAEQKGAVWYYREAGQGEPPPQAMEVMKAVVEARLPIRLSSRPDYSDAIGPDGKPIQQ